MSRERQTRGLAVLGSRYRVVRADDCDACDRYLAGSDSRRAGELNRWLRDPDVRAIFVARGGYGIMRILDDLDADALRRDPKPIVGFSDVTALLWWALGRAGVRGVHGPVVRTLGEATADDVAWLWRVLEGGLPRGPLPWALQPIGAARGGRVEGPLLGGNLCVASHLIGTPYALDLDGAVVFAEDVGERPYAVDRYLTGMKLTGALDGVAAALIGSFRPERHPDEGAVVDVIAERLAAFGIPGLAGLPVGHGPRNAALPFGAACAVDLDANTIEFPPPAGGG